MVRIPQANSKGSYEPGHLHSLARTFAAVLHNYRALDEGIISFRITGILSFRIMDILLFRIMGNSSDQLYFIIQDHGYFIIQDHGYFIIQDHGYFINTTVSSCPCVEVNRATFVRSGEYAHTLLTVYITSGCYSINVSLRLRTEFHYYMYLLHVLLLAN